jgi:hypothetical protein
MTPVENSVRTVRSYKKTPTIQVPAIPSFVSPFLSQSGLSLAHSGALPLAPSSPEDLASSSVASLSPLGSPFSNLSESSSQPRLIRAPQDTTQKLEVKFKRMEEILGDFVFDSIGEFLQILFYNPTRVIGKEDPRGVAHGLAVARFLQGKTKIKMSDIIILIYSHKHSAPSWRSTQYHERHAPFSPSVSPAEIFHARPSLFTWATNLVANHVHREIYELAAKEDDNHLRASTNGRRPDSVNLVTWETLGSLVLRPSARNTKLAHLFLGISLSLWLHHARTALWL